MKHAIKPQKRKPQAKPKGFGKPKEVSKPKNTYKLNNFAKVFGKSARPVKLPDTLKRYSGMAQCRDSNHTFITNGTSVEWVIKRLDDLVVDMFGVGYAYRSEIWDHSVDKVVAACKTLNYD